jgi:exodeoxyribonuclease V alpha subunit
MSSYSSAPHQNRDSLERLSGSIERVTFHSEATGFYVLRVKVKGNRDLVTVVGSAASVTAGEFIECWETWNNSAEVYRDGKQLPG